MLSAQTPRWSPLQSRPLHPTPPGQPPATLTSNTLSWFCLSTVCAWNNLMHSDECLLSLYIMCMGVSHPVRVFADCSFSPLHSILWGGYTRIYLVDCDLSLPPHDTLPGICIHLLGPTKSPEHCFPSL